jgi:photosystem II stability/assembly factor-like uncharacterized protein
MGISFFVLLSAATALGQWQVQESPTKESLRGVSAVNENVVWASGTHGTYLLTTDGVKGWAAHQVPGAEELDFRGVKAFGAEAFLLAAGPGDKSRIYHTADSGRHWELQFTNSEPKGFLDCMAFSDAKHGMVVGDPVNGRFQILRTDNGGKNWRYAESKRIPAAIEGEGAFAASNSCIAVDGQKNAWFVTGGSVARVFHSSDGGVSWSVSETPVVHGAASQGIFSVTFKDTMHGVIAGGDYAHPDQGGVNLAVTDDGGKTWKLAAIQPQKYFSAVAYVRGGPPDSAIAVGSSGSALSKDGFHTWDFFLPAGFNSIDSSNATLYAVGANGAIGRMQIPKR